jgi:hypothetical protein
MHVRLGELRMEALVGEMAAVKLSSEQERRVQTLLEMQYERQRMFTSCGWFFEDFDRIEPRNNVAYAAQAVRLARQATGVDLETRTAQDLQQVVSPSSGVRACSIFLERLGRAEQAAGILPGASQATL